MGESASRPVVRLLRRVRPLGLDTTIGEAARRIAETGCGLPVVDDAGRLVGYLGERALLRAITPGYLRELRDTEFFTRDLSVLGRWVREGAGSLVADHMTESTAFVRIDDSETHAAELFLHHAVRALPVVDDDEVIGVLRLGDLIDDLMQSVTAPESGGQAG